MKKITDRIILALWFLAYTMAWRLARKLRPAKLSSALDANLGHSPANAPAGVRFYDQNFKLDDGTETLPGKILVPDRPYCQAATRLLGTLFPDNRGKARVMDIGCLEGGYAATFARMGFESVGLEVRESNIAACEYLRSELKLPNLSYIKDDAWNIEKYGTFDATFCAGLLYHLHDPRRYLEILGRITNRVLIVHTHFAPESFMRSQRSHLSPMVEHEGMRGRWFAEFPKDTSQDTQETLRWAAWGNHRSFWMTRESILQTLRDVGFDMVFEQFDLFGNDIAEAMRTGYYARDCRSSFVGIKTKK